jgi:hypothetical protein
MSSHAFPFEQERRHDAVLARHGARIDGVEKEQDEQKKSLLRIETTVNNRFFALMLFAIAQLATGLGAVVGILLTRKG